MRFKITIRARNLFGSAVDFFRNHFNARSDIFTIRAHLALLQNCALSECQYRPPARGLPSLGILGAAQ